MKKTHSRKLTAIAMLMLVPFAVLSAAGGGGGPGGAPGFPDSSVQGIGDTDRLRDQDQIRDPATQDGIEPIQDRLQERDLDRVMIDGNASSGVSVGQQNQVRMQLMERTFVPGATNTEELLRTRIQMREQYMEQSRILATTTQLQSALREQNRSRVAVQTMLDVNALFGERATEVSRIATQIAASIEKTVELEAKIQSRGYLRRFFMGGDAHNAAQLEAELDQVRDRIREMDRLVGECDCDMPTQTLLREQLRLLEQDRDRLSKIVTDQYERTGLIGWMFR